MANHESGSRKLRVEEAFQDEVLELLADGFPAPDRHFGPVFRERIPPQEAAEALAAYVMEQTGTTPLDFE